MTRDTSLYSPLQGLTKTKKPGLRTLAKLVLGLDIQDGEHSSVCSLSLLFYLRADEKVRLGLGDGC